MPKSWIHPYSFTRLWWIITCHGFRQRANDRADLVSHPILARAIAVADIP